MSIENLFKKEHYFKIGEAVEEVKHANDGKEVAIASSKLVGKALGNTGIFAGKLTVLAVKNLPKIMEEVQKQQAKSKR
ncbi:hypothetical protein CO608_09080 [Lysobacteraceae bacterium NML08-0793]|nr:hypothetical protein CO608_09080 [Xanthomonadaceae bacterium NML08-0793]